MILGLHFVQIGNRLAATTVQLSLAGVETELSNSSFGVLKRNQQGYKLPLRFIGENDQNPISCVPAGGLKLGYFGSNEYWICTASDLPPVPGEFATYNMSLQAQGAKSLVPSKSICVSCKIFTIL
jgi:hypothetical protein